VRVTALTVDRRRLNLAPRDFPAPPRVVGRVELPSPYAPNSAAFQRVVAAALGRARLRPDAAARPVRRRDSAGRAAADHPVARCPEAPAHLRAAERAERLRRDVERLERRVAGRTDSLARQLDRVLDLLGARGYGGVGPHLGGRAAGPGVPRVRRGRRRPPRPCGRRAGRRAGSSGSGARSG